MLFITVENLRNRTRFINVQLTLCECYIRRRACTDLEITDGVLSKIYIASFYKKGHSHPYCCAILLDKVPGPLTLIQCQTTKRRREFYSYKEAIAHLLISPVILLYSDMETINYTSILSFLHLKANMLDVKLRNSTYTLKRLIIMRNQTNFTTNNTFLSNIRPRKGVEMAQVMGAHKNTKPTKNGLMLG